MEVFLIGAAASAASAGFFGILFAVSRRKICRHGVGENGEKVYKNGTCRNMDGRDKTKDRTSDRTSDKTESADMSGKVWIGEGGTQELASSAGGAAVGVKKRMFHSPVRSMTGILCLICLLQIMVLPCFANGQTSSGLNANGQGVNGYSSNGQVSAGSYTNGQELNSQREAETGTAETEKISLYFDDDTEPLSIAAGAASYDRTVWAVFSYRGGRKAEQVRRALHIRAVDRDGKTVRKAYHLGEWKTDQSGEDSEASCFRVRVCFRKDAIYTVRFLADDQDADSDDGALTEEQGTYIDTGDPGLPLIFIIDRKNPGRPLYDLPGESEQSAENNETGATSSEESGDTNTSLYESAGEMNAPSPSESSEELNASSSEGTGESSGEVAAEADGQDARGEENGITQADNAENGTAQEDSAENGTAQAGSEEGVNGSTQADSAESESTGEQWTFTMSPETAAINRKYVTKASDVTVTVGNARPFELESIRLYRNTQEVPLTENIHYSLKNGDSSQKTEDSAQKTEDSAQTPETEKKNSVLTVMLPAENFAQDGVYRLVFNCRDVDGHEFSSGDQVEHTLNFGVDSTPPTAEIRDLAENTVYHETVKNIAVSADDNLKLMSLQIFLDGQPSPTAAWDKEALEEMKKQGKLCAVQVVGDREKKTHTFRLVAQDEAGNVTEKQIGTFYVRTPFWRYLLWPGILAAVTGAATGIIFVLKRHRRQQHRMRSRRKSGNNTNTDKSGDNRKKAAAESKKSADKSQNAGKQQMQRKKQRKR